MGVAISGIWEWSESFHVSVAVLEEFHVTLDSLRLTLTINCVTCVATVLIFSRSKEKRH